MHKQVLGAGPLCFVPCLVIARLRADRGRPNEVSVTKRDCACACQEPRATFCGRRTHKSATFLSLSRQRTTISRDNHTREAVKYYPSASACAALSFEIITRPVGELAHDASATTTGKPNAIPDIKNGKIWKSLAPPVMRVSSFLSNRRGNRRKLPRAN